MGHRLLNVLAMIAWTTIVLTFHPTSKSPACDITSLPRQHDLGVLSPAVAFVAVVSMQRSSSSTLTSRVLAEGNQCVISLNEIFQNATDQSGDAWAVDGESMKGRKWHLEPSLLGDFLIRVAKRRCAENVRRDAQNRCNNKCIAGFKEFDDQLSPKQHEWIWKHTPNMTVVVLERDVKARWKSRWVAAKTQDWDTQGSLKHKVKIEAMEIPSIEISESKEYCTKGNDNPWRQLCHFQSVHKHWYTFVRKTLSPNERVEVSFDEVVTKDGSEARNRIAAALPGAFQNLLD